MTKRLSRELLDQLRLPAMDDPSLHTQVLPARHTPCHARDRPHSLVKTVIPLEAHPSSLNLHVLFSHHSCDTKGYYSIYHPRELLSTEEKNDHLSC